jgi:hypothetical protein
MITVGPKIYRALWTICAILSAMLTLAPLLLISRGVQVNDGGPMIIASGALGAGALAYSVWRLGWPFKRRK